MRPRSSVYPLRAILGGSRCKASLVAWLVWVVLLSAWHRVCIVEPFNIVSAILASSSMKSIHLLGCILEKKISSSYYHNHDSLKHMSYMKKMHLDEVNLF